MHEQCSDNFHAAKFVVVAIYKICGSACMMRRVIGGRLHVIDDVIEKHPMVCSIGKALRAYHLKTITTDE